MDKEIPKSIHNLATSHDFQPSVRIGKSGITDLLIEEIDSQLTKKNVGKNKINRGLVEKQDMKDVLNNIAEEIS